MDDIKKYSQNQRGLDLLEHLFFEENKKSADGQYARTTHDQYGEVSTSIHYKKCIRRWSCIRLSSRTWSQLSMKMNWLM